MLRKCTREEFERNIDFAYELATDLTKSGYPTYCDGIKTKEMFIQRSFKAFERDTEDMLLFIEDNKILGFIHYYSIPEDNYLGTNSFNIQKDTEIALSEFIEYVTTEFKGYDLFMGFPADNQSAVKYLSNKGFECIEDDYNNSAFLQTLDNLTENKDLIRIYKDNYDLFRTLHCQIDHDMYWNSERILEDLDNWVIFVKETDGKPQGAVYYMDERDDWFEIFGIDLDNNQYNPDIFMELLNAALYDAKQRNGRVMSFFCDEEYEQYAVRCGFECVGNYRCYKIHIN